jgi:hypothetical protein
MLRAATDNEAPPPTGDGDGGGISLAGRAQAGAAGRKAPLVLTRMQPFGLLAGLQQLNCYAPGRGGIQVADKRSVPPLVIQKACSHADRADSERRETEG